MPRPKKKIAEVKEADFKDFFEIFSVSLDSMGEFLTRVGDLEKKTGIGFNEASKLMNDKKFLDTLVSKLSPEDLGLFLKIVFRFSTFDRIDINKLSPDDKIKMGMNMKEQAKDVKKLYDRLNKYLSKKGEKE